MSSTLAVTYGDGIGPEIMEATLLVMKEAGARIEIAAVEMGQRLYDMGSRTGILPSSTESLRKTRVLLKAPTNMPPPGFQSPLSFLTSEFGVQAAVRQLLLPGHWDLTLIRECAQTEPQEYRLSADMLHQSRIVTRSRMEAFLRYVFEYAAAHRQKKICIAGGESPRRMMEEAARAVFERISKEYGGIKAEYVPLSIASGRLATSPEDFDMIATLIPEGRLLANIPAAKGGKIHTAEAHLGTDFALFEAIADTNPQIAGKGMADPSAMFLAGAMALAHLGQQEAAERLQNALMRTHEEKSEKIENTQDFTLAVIDRLGKKPRKNRPAALATASLPPPLPPETAQRELVGVDVFMDIRSDELPTLASKLESSHLPIPLDDFFALQITSGEPNSGSTDQLCCRFLSDTPVTHFTIADLISALCKAGISFTRLENLYLFDGAPAYPAKK